MVPALSNSPISTMIRNMLNYEDVLFKNFFQNESVFDSVFKPLKYNYPVDIYIDNDSNNLCIDIAAVGVDKKNINIEVKDNILKVLHKKEDGTAGVYATPEEEKYIHKGIASRAFNFGWKFSSNKIKVEKLSAKLDKGLLQIRIPIEEEKIKANNYKKINID